MPSAIRPMKLSAPASVFSPRVRRARGLRRPNQPSSRVVLAAHQAVPTGHEVPQLLAHLWIQAHPPLGHRLPQCQEHRAGRRRPFPYPPLQDGEQDPVQMGQGVLVEAADVPPPRCAACARHTAGGPVPTRPGPARRRDRRRSSGPAPRARPGP